MNEKLCITIVYYGLLILYLILSCMSIINKRRLCLLGRKLFRTRVNILVGGGRHGIIC